jgi:hypothetical protein
MHEKVPTTFQNLGIAAKPEVPQSVFRVSKVQRPHRTDRQFPLCLRVTETLRRVGMGSRWLAGSLPAFPDYMQSNNLVVWAARQAHGRIRGHVKSGEHWQTRLNARCPLRRSSPGLLNVGGMLPLVVALLR